MQLVLFQASAVFLVCLGVHIFVWRTYPVRNQGIRLGLIFLVLPIIVGGVAFLASILDPMPLLEIQWFSWGLAYILHVALSGSYMFLYTAVSGVSPSIAILENVEASMPKGLKRGDIAPKCFTDSTLSGARLDNLLVTGFIQESAGVLRLSFRGWLIAVSFLIFRRFLGLPDVAKG